MYDKPTFLAILWALGLNFVNHFVSLLAFEFGYSRKYTLFLLYTMGGMVVRMFALLTIIFVILKFGGINNIVFILIFFTFYFILLVLEAYSFLKESNYTKKL